MLKKHVVFNFRKGFGKRTVKKMAMPDVKTLLFFVFMICGIIIGTYIYKKGSQEALWFFDKLFGNFILPLKDDSYIRAFSKMFLPFFLLILLCYLIGFSGTGTLFLSFIPFLCGILAGLYISLCYNSFNGKEVVCRILIFLPLYATATATLIKCCCRSSVISGEIFSFVLTGKGEGKGFLKEYTTEYIVFIVPVVLSCVVSLLIFYTLKNSFNVFG